MPKDWSPSYPGKKVSTLDSKAGNGNPKGKKSAPYADTKGSVPENQQGHKTGHPYTGP